MSKMIAKAKKKSNAELSLLRIQYAKHLFEIMEGLFLVMEKPEFPAAGATYVTFNDLADVFNEAQRRGKKALKIEGYKMTTDFAAFCLDKYDNIDPSFDEKMMEYYAKKAEALKDGKE